MTAAPIRIAINVIGTPATAGSKDAIPFHKGNGKLGVRVKDNNEKSMTWRSQVVDAARTQYNGPLLRGALRVSMTFYRPRPKWHFGTGRNAGRLKPSAPKHPTTKPDLTKLLRCAEDALKGVLWSDDSLVVSQINEKRYGEPARAEIVVEDMA